ncbi:hypothetical protein [Polycyclovorans algicola]|uniref:hypothetical protein n=1 Tax=Polycyclovorans algicola TaxID=616992 RepID=UPI0004A6EA2B|nr:hypothetical protein [Polycyclovorans algicola]
MPAIRILTAVALALTVTLAVLMAVVCLMMGMHLDLRPSLRDEWPTLVNITVIFSVLAVFSAVAFVSLRRAWTGWWIAQTLMWVAIVFASFLIRALLLG